jgi:phage terminase large subunit
MLPEPVEIGVDVARFGADESVAYARRGPDIIAAEYWRGQDTVVSTGRVVKMAREYEAVCIKIDDPGIGGGVTDQLRAVQRAGELPLPFPPRIRAARLEQGLPVDVEIQAINVGNAAWAKEKFYDRRSELYWGLRERFKTGDISIPKDDILLSQLTALKYSYTSRGQIRVEGKDELRKRRPQGAKWMSPDRADALMICYSQAGMRWEPAAVGGSEGVTIRLPEVG